LRVFREKSEKEKEWAYTEIIKEGRERYEKKGGEIALEGRRERVEGGRTGWRGLGGNYIKTELSQVQR